MKATKNKAIRILDAKISEAAKEIDTAKAAYMTACATHRQLEATRAAIVEAYTRTKTGERKVSRRKVKQAFDDMRSAANGDDTAPVVAPPT